MRVIVNVNLLRADVLHIVRLPRRFLREFHRLLNELQLAIAVDHLIRLCMPDESIIVRIKADQHGGGRKR